MFDGGRSTVAASFRRLNDNRAGKFAPFDNVLSKDYSLNTE